MIDRRELLVEARKRNLPLGMIEKDYVLGWLLFGLSDFAGLVFKGGTALSKIYLPKMFRLSEDLDFVFAGDFSKITDTLEGILERIAQTSGIGMRIKSRHSNPDYLQLKIQYDAVLGKNWIKLDVTREMPIYRVWKKSIKSYSDYPGFEVNVESIEEICAEKIRSLIERKKCRDYFDVWHLMQMGLVEARIKRLLWKKFAYKNIDFEGPEQFLPSDLFEELEGYWHRELGRLVWPVPDLKAVISDLKERLGFIRGD